MPRSPGAREGRRHRGGEGLRGEPKILEELLAVAVRHEGVGDAEAQYAGTLGDALEHRAAEAAREDVLLDGYEEAVGIRQLEEELLV